MDPAAIVFCDLDAAIQTFLVIGDYGAIAFCDMDCSGKTVLTLVDHDDDVGTPSVLRQVGGEFQG